MISFEYRYYFKCFFIKLEVKSLLSCSYWHKKIERNHNLPRSKVFVYSLRILLFCCFAFYRGSIVRVAFTITFTVFFLFLYPGYSSYLIAFFQVY